MSKFFYRKAPVPEPTVESSLDQDSGLERPSATASIELVSFELGITVLNCNAWCCH